MQGQANHFNLYAPEKMYVPSLFPFSHPHHHHHPRPSPYAINSYLSETRRLYSVLEAHLATRDYLVGGAYGLADIKAFAWVRIADRSGVPLAEFPRVKAWVDRIAARPAVQAGLAVPAPAK